MVIALHVVKRSEFIATNHGSLGQDFEIGGHMLLQALLRLRICTVTALKTKQRHTLVLYQQLVTFHYKLAIIEGSGK